MLSDVDDYRSVLGDDAPRWLTYDEAAGYLGVHRRTILRAVQSGDLKARRFGTTRVIRIDARSLVEYFAPV